MKDRLHLIQKCIILIFCLLPMHMQGQRILHVGVDSLICQGDSALIRVGIGTGNEIIVAEEITGVDISGSEVTRINDSSFWVSAPAAAVGETTVEYSIVIHTLAGDDIDTIVTVHYLSTYHFYDTAIFCYGEEYVWHDIKFPDSGNYDMAYQTAAGCDSIWHVTLWGRDSGFVATPLISDDGINWYSDTMLAGCRPMMVWLKSGTPHAAHSWWLLNDTTWLEGDQITHEYDSIGIFSITYITESERGCRDTAIMPDAVWVFGKPEAAFAWTPEQPSTSHPIAQFFNQSTAYTGGAIGDRFTMSYLWTLQTSSGQDSVRGENPVYNWGEEGENVFGEFSVILTATQNYVDGPYGDTARCEDTTSANITIVNDWLQFPNIVSPNGDGTNDIWKVVNLLECGLYTMNELWIYNKWGTLEYHVKNIAEEDDFWDPEKTHSPDGTYFFRFSAKSMFGIVRTNGMIEVVR